MKLKILKLNPQAKLPTYAHPGDAAFDLYVSEDIRLGPGERISAPTGLAMEIPEGYVGLIWDKSGLSHTHGVKTLGGVIDASYRGEVRVGLINLSDKMVIFEKGHKIAQMLIQKVEIANLIEVETLSDTSRGDKGFGSTGK